MLWRTLQSLVFLCCTLKCETMPWHVSRWQLNTPLPCNFIPQQTIKNFTQSSLFIAIIARVYYSQKTQKTHETAVQLRISNFYYIKLKGLIFSQGKRESVGDDCDDPSLLSALRTPLAFIMNLASPLLTRNSNAIVSLKTTLYVSSQATFHCLQFNQQAHSSSIWLI